MEKEMFYPKPGTPEYNFLLAPKEKRKKTLKKWKWANKWIVVPLYRLGILPLFGLGKVFLLLYTKGWKTGKKRITPVEYHKKEGKICIFASRGERTHWLRNMRNSPEDVDVKIGFKKYKAKVEIIDDIKERIKILEWYILTYPKPAKMLMGWDPKVDTIENRDLTFIAKNIVPVIIELEKKKK